eukprot:GAHX01003851.1.p1 GENE.GAHX01003851.1~~GAHX01003851.1.p1  ORF type:complete len:335 (+),score=45.30 GAHX01003851.1:36-1040(+)
MKVYKIDNANFPSDIFSASISDSGSYLIGIGTYPHQYFIYSLPTASFIVSRCSSDIYVECEILSKDTINSFVLLKNQRTLDYHSNSGLVKSTKLYFQCFHIRYLDELNKILCIGITKMAFCSVLGELGKKITFKDEIVAFSKTNDDNLVLIVTSECLHLVDIQKEMVVSQLELPSYLKDCEMRCFGDLRLYAITQNSSSCRFLALSVTGELFELNYKKEGNEFTLTKERESFLDVLGKLYEANESLASGKEYEMTSFIANELYLLVSINSAILIIDIETFKIVKTLDVEEKIQWIRNVKNSGTLLFGKYGSNSIFVMNCDQIGLSKNWAKYVNQ